MDDRRRLDPEAEVLPGPAATRLLERASELDADRLTGAALADLRAAALEAGITADAFDAAVAELRDGAQARVPVVRQQRRRPWRKGLTITLAVLLALGSLAVSRMLVPASSGPPMIEEAIVLRCLSPGEAAELIRPLLGLPTNSIVYSPARAPRVVTIRATPAQIQEVRSKLDEYERADSPTCATRLAPASVP